MIIAAKFSVKLRVLCCLKDLSMRRNAKLVCHKLIAVTRVTGNIELVKKWVELRRSPACFENIDAGLTKSHWVVTGKHIKFDY